tara:strand:+ start:1047 stop:3455 length:2409 start_codon:yes stop_codon:yes gene_type:complete
MAESIMKDYFPSQVAPDIEKVSEEYGLKVAKAIESEWFVRDGVTYRFANNQDSFHRLRLYARGEQSVQKYKDELSINGDLSYLNLDWKPVPIIPKFVDIVVNGIAERMYDIKAYSQDPYGVDKRTRYMENMLIDMANKEFNEQVKAVYGKGILQNNEEDIPENKEELELHMQLNYKQAVEVAEEQAIATLLAGNKYELTRKRFYYDLTVLGIGAVKTSFNTSEGVTVEYVDPANLVWSHTDDPYFEDIYYVGEVKTIPINELVKQFPELSNEELEEISGQSFRKAGYYNTAHDYDEIDKNQIQVLYFNYKTYSKEVYKVKDTATGGTKVIVKDETFNPVLDDALQARFGKLERQIEVLYEGALILGSDKLLKWELAKNMMRPKSDFTKVKMNYNIVAPRMYKGKIESLVGRITGFADMIQLTHLKLQQVLARMVPDGIFMDADGLAEVDLGNGTNYNPQEALNMFFQTGSIIGRSLTADGDPNMGKIPIQEISSGNGGGKLQSLVQTYNYYLQMIRDVTGLNEARDGSTPDKNALVGVQKIAAANSNTATRHILQAGLFLTAEVAEALSLRISDILEFSPTKDAFIQAIGAHNVGTLEEMAELHLYDFGIFIELEPDEEEKQLLENNIQMALTQQSIELEDAIDLRTIKNVKLANQLLKIRRKKKQERDQELQQQNIKAQADANAQAQEVAAQAEIKKQQAIVEMQSQLEKIKADMASKKLQEETVLKKDLMNHEFELNMKLKNMEDQAIDKKESIKEDRKDQRVKLQGEEQRKSKRAAKNFESSGNDTLGQGIDMSVFNPR